VETSAPQTRSLPLTGTRPEGSRHRLARPADGGPHDRTSPNRTRGSHALTPGSRSPAAHLSGPPASRRSRAGPAAYMAARREARRVAERRAEAKAASGRRRQRARRGSSCGSERRSGRRPRRAVAPDSAPPNLSLRVPPLAADEPRARTRTGPHPPDRARRCSATLRRRTGLDSVPLLLLHAPSLGADGESCWRPWFAGRQSAERPPAVRGSRRERRAAAASGPTAAAPESGPRRPPPASSLTRRTVAAGSRARRSTQARRRRPRRAPRACGGVAPCPRGSVR
jgi:hypothetical protein